MGPKVLSNQMHRWQSGPGRVVGRHPLPMVVNLSGTVRVVMVGEGRGQAMAEKMVPARAD